MGSATLQVNDNNDLYLPDGRNLVIISPSVDSVSQNAKQAARMRLAENSFNTLEGVDYFGTVFTGTVNLDNFRVSLRATLLAVPDVIDINSLTITSGTNSTLPSQSNDVLNYSATLLTPYGTVAISGAS